MFEFIVNPYKAIEKHGKPKSSVFLWLIFPSIILPLAMWISSLGSSITKINDVTTYLYGIILIYAIVLFIAQLLMLIVKTFTGKSKYTTALTVFTRTAFVASFWILIWSLVSLIPSEPIVLLFTAIIIPIMVVLSTTVLIKSMMKMYSMDLLMAVIVLSILFMAISTVFYMMGLFVGNMVLNAPIGKVPGI